METVKLFQFHGLRISLLVCDGSPANLATIKLTHGHVGAYSLKSDTTGDKFEVKPFMINPTKYFGTHQVRYNFVFLF